MKGNVCAWRGGQEGKGDGESMCMGVCSCEDNSRRGKRERKCLRIFFRANSPEKSDLEVVNCTLKSSLSAGDLPRKCLAL